MKLIRARHPSRTKDRQRHRVPAPHPPRCIHQPTQRDQPGSQKRDANHPVAQKMAGLAEQVVYPPPDMLLHFSKQTLHNRPEEVGSVVRRKRPRRLVGDHKQSQYHRPPGPNPPPTRGATQPQLQRIRLLNKNRAHTQAYQPPSPCSAFLLSSRRDLRLPVLAVAYPLPLSIFCSSLRAEWTSPPLAGACSCPCSLPHQHPGRSFRAKPNPATKVQHKRTLRPWYPSGPEELRRPQLSILFNPIARTRLWPLLGAFPTPRGNSALPA